MAEPDFEQLARRLLDEQITVSHLLDPDSRELVAVVAEQLRQVWNARGAMDVEKVVAEIETWDDGDQIRCHFDDDGAGHRDFSRLTVTAEGRSALAKILAP